MFTKISCTIKFSAFSNIIFSTGGIWYYIVIIIFFTDFKQWVDTVAKNVGSSPCFG